MNIRRSVLLSGLGCFALMQADYQIQITNLAPNQGVFATTDYRSIVYWAIPDRFPANTNVNSPDWKALGQGTSNFIAAILPFGVTVNISVSDNISSLFFLKKSRFTNPISTAIMNPDYTVFTKTVIALRELGANSNIAGSESVAPGRNNSSAIFFANDPMAVPVTTVPVKTPMPASGSNIAIVPVVGPFSSSIDELKLTVINKADVPSYFETWAADMIKLNNLTPRQANSQDPGFKAYIAELVQTFVSLGFTVGPNLTLLTKCSKGVCPTK